MRIDRIDPEGYAETEVSRIEPGWDSAIVAAHTYNRAGDLHVIDMVRRRPKLPWVAR
jgi:hypothetical protein